MARGSQRGRNNNNPHGHNQYTNEWMETARDHPFATAAAVAGAVGAGVFLWSKRNQVGNQVNKISRTASEMSRRASSKASDWIDQMQSRNSNSEFATAEGINEPSTARSSRGATGSRSSAARSTGSATRSTRGPAPDSGQTVGSEKPSVETFNS